MMYLSKLELHTCKTWVTTSHVVPNFDATLTSSASRYIGDHFGNLLWGQTIGDTQPNHRFYESQGIKTEGSFFAKATQKLTSKLTGFLDLQFRGIDYNVDGTVSYFCCFRTKRQS